MTTETQAPDPAPRPFTAVKTFADSVLAMLDERIKAVDKAAHPFNDYFGDQPETIVAAKAQAGELREVRTQVRILGDRALVDLMKFKPAIPAPEGAQDGERAAFEAFCLTQPFLSKLSHVIGRDCYSDAGYDHAAVNAAWHAFRAGRAALAAQAPAEAHGTEPLPHVIEERDAYASELARCRDAFPIPEPGTALDEPWQMAMGDPLCVADYVTAAIANVQPKGMTAEGLHDAQLDLGPQRVVLHFCTEADARRFHERAVAQLKGKP